MTRPSFSMAEPVAWLEYLKLEVAQFRQAFVIAVGDKSPFAKQALQRIDDALAHPPASELPQCVLDLIAVLNGDGGHYRAEHGLEAACKRAEKRYYASPASEPDNADKWESGELGTDLAHARAVSKEEEALIEAALAAPVTDAEVEASIEGLTQLAKLFSNDTDVVEVANDAAAMLRKLAAEKAEGESILLQAGPITCRNGKLHERIDGCLYCLLARRSE